MEGIEQTNCKLKVYYKEPTNPQKHSFSKMSDNMTMTMVEEVIHRRVRCEYSFLESRIMTLSSANVLNELEILLLKCKSVIFENQQIIASQVKTCFLDRFIINVMVVAKTQSGKTGSMCATIKELLEDTSNPIPPENIYIITGLSSCEWKEQTKERIPKSIHNIFHRSELPDTFADDIKEKKNILIIMDEIQVAAKKGQTIYKTFDKAGLLNKQHLYKNDIKILEYTATPDGTIYDLMKWGNSSAKILGTTGQGYVGAYDLFLAGRVKQYKELCGYNKKTGETDPVVFDNITEIKNDVDAYSTPLYHLIRTKNGDDQRRTIDNFDQIFGFGPASEYTYIQHDGNSEEDDVNKTLKIRPARHTFIFIKEKLRCAKTLFKLYGGIKYERFTLHPDDAVIIQGLIGRDTGYDNNGISIVYTNIESIKKYEKLWNSHFDDMSVQWNSKTTKFVNGILTGKDTFNELQDDDTLTETSDTETVVEVEPVIQRFTTQEEVKAYYKRVLKPRSIGGHAPHKIKMNANGFYESTLRSVKRVYSCTEITNNRRFGLVTGNNYISRYYACYENVADKNTLQFWLIHYD